MDVLLCNSRLLIWLFLPRYGRHEMTLGHSFSGQHWPLLRSPPCVQDDQWIPTTVQCCASPCGEPKVECCKALDPKGKTRSSRRPVDLQGNFKEWVIFCSNELFHVFLWICFCFCFFITKLWLLLSRQYKDSFWQSSKFVQNSWMRILVYWLDLKEPKPFTLFQFML